MNGTSLKLDVAPVFAPLLQPSRYKGAHGGRGSGKSHFFATLMVASALKKSGFRGACFREVQKSIAKSSKLLIEDKIRELGVQSLFQVLETEIRTPGGGFIVFEGMQNHTVDSIKSLEGFDVGWVEEAQSVSNRSLDLLRPTFRSKGSELWFGWNPNSPKDPVDQLLRGEHPPRGAIIVEANFHDNPWFPDELADEQEDDRQRDPEKWSNVWAGQYGFNSNARVFRNWKTEAFETPDNAIHRFGADWGFAVDPTVLVRCHIEGRTLFVDAEAWEVGCEIDKTPSLFETVEGAKKWLIRADSARPETVSYMKRQGFKIVGALKGQGSVEDGIEFLRAFDIVVHPRCQHVADELLTYSYKIDPKTEEVLPVLEDKNNHTIDALRYALEELRRSGYRPAAEKKPIMRDRYWPTDDDGGDNWKTV